MSRLSIHFCVLSLFSSVFACNVPVFRYALERWSPDPYPAFLFYKGELDVKAKEIIEWVNTADGVDAPIRNLYIEPLDVDKLEDEVLLKIYKEQKNEQLPLLVVMFPPQSRIPGPLWSGPLSKEAIEKISESPARREVVNRILKGDSSVWVLIECGDKAKDDAAEKKFKEEFVELKKVLQLPAQNELDFADGTGADSQAGSGIPLKLEFSLVRISRKDPLESIFIDMLMKTESDLFEHVGQPMAFPIFGRGRVLYAYIGKGINSDTIYEACAFLTGACSCQVKEQNPGTDLLLSVDWENVVSGSVVVDRALPPLSGAGDLITKQGTSKPGSVSENTVRQYAFAKEAFSKGSGTEGGGPLTLGNPLMPKDESLLDEAPMDEEMAGPTVAGESRSSLARNLVITIGILLGLMMLGTLLVKK
ncbi:MAG: hypothetical protein O3B01_15075 [Planctomycetota bacterium]|nr:hypothetical protein [Planctomycetota bacterium]MDA1139895.1 hypothetical protein [Planctomycetota bacterium]